MGKHIKNQEVKVFVDVKIKKETKEKLESRRKQEVTGSHRMNELSRQRKIDEFNKQHLEKVYKGISNARERQAAQIREEQKLEDEKKIR